MKIIELFESLQSYCSRHPNEAKEQELVVQTVNGGVPHQYMSPVVSMTPGADWTRRMFIVRTADNLAVEKKIEGTLREVAEQRLKELQEAHKQLGFMYTIRLGSKSREAQAWIEGFIEGVRLHFTGEK